MICETFLNNKNKSLCEIPGYKLVEKHRKSIKQGGVAIYIKRNLKFKKRTDLNIFKEGQLESYFIELTPDI